MIKNLNKFFNKSGDLEDDYFGDLNSDNTDDLNKEKTNSTTSIIEQNILNEGLLDVIFNKIIYNLKVSLQGNILEFRVFLPGTKTLFKLRIRKDIAFKYKKWIDKLFEDIEE